MRDIPTLVWLILALAAVVVHRELPMPRWLMIHLVLLGAITHAILVWSQYFSFALLRAASTVADRRSQNWRLILVNGGAALVLVGVPTHTHTVTLAGAAAIIAGVAWHAGSIVRRLRASLPGKFGHTVRFYIASAGMLIIGAGIGAWLAVSGSTPGLVLSHAVLNVLGWIGITVAGTVVTLWPTILRTRADEFAPVGAARALPVLAGAVLIAALGSALLSYPLLALGLFGYLAGLALIGVSLIRAARRTVPQSSSALSVGLALTWWAGSVAVIFFTLLGNWAGEAALPAIAATVDAVVPYLVAGFALQVLVGALSYLVPVVLGGGPGPVRVGTAAFERFGVLRVTLANIALLACALPVSSLARVVASALYVIAMASFLPIMVVGMRAQRRAKQQIEDQGPASQSALPAGAGETARAKTVRPSPALPKPAHPKTGQAVAGLMTVVLALAVAGGIDPIGMGTVPTPDGSADAPVKVVSVEAADMRFTPAEIEVQVGTRLIIELTNTDVGHTHDLVFENGVAGSRLAPGASERIDVGVITADLEGWCSIVGHRQLGMELEIIAVGTGGEAGTNAGDGTNGGVGTNAGDGTDSGAGSDGSTPHAAHGTPAHIDLSAISGPDFIARDATLPALDAREPITHEVTLEVEDIEVEVAPGVTQTLWTYNGMSPGPTLHGRVGDRFIVTLINNGAMGHSIDFHAGELAPDVPMRTIGPGESLTYEFTAKRSGIWLYHCSTMPMSAHIANGMFGAVVIESPDMPPVDQSFVFVQNEYYLGDHDGGEVNTDALLADEPDLVVFNGHANQYKQQPLRARTGERVRIWVLDAGPSRAMSFHVVGGQFDTVWSEGRYLINREAATGSQALGLLPAQGGFVELVLPEAGNYPFVSHFMVDAERGAHGVIAVVDP